MLLFDDDLLDNEKDAIQIKIRSWKVFHYLLCLWVLKYRYFVVVVVSPALGAVCRDLGLCSWSTAFADGLFLTPPPPPPPPVTDQLQRLRCPPAQSTLSRPCHGCQAAASGYRYRPASDHVTMWRDVQSLSVGLTPGRNSSVV